jgi:prepilin-type N-terminal cleavage/methylation domain-containing protein
MEKQKGFTLIELMIVVALLGILAYGIAKFFTNTFGIWWQTSQQIYVQQNARTAIDEMTKFIRQASPVTGIAVGQQAGENLNTMISFTDIDGRKMSYYKSGGSLKRVLNSAISNVIPKNLISIYFVLDSTTTPTCVYISTLTVQTPVTGGEKGSITLPTRTIFLRN